MKTLGKLKINPEKVIKNEELVNLKGSYSGVNCCYCDGHGILLITRESDCYTECVTLWGTAGHWLC